MFPRGGRGDAGGRRQERRRRHQLLGVQVQHITLRLFMFQGVKANLEKVKMFYYHFYAPLFNFT